MSAPPPQPQGTQWEWQDIRLKMSLLKVAGFFKEGEQIHKSNADCMKNLKTILDLKLSPSQTPSLQTAGQIKKNILQVTEVSGRAETKIQPS